ncbi:hypothetical protein E2562_022859 [Oryza meyeriana var. granulata]|uniref:Uncharacterized protein n=1 Tax=Oryza meyeriana var. granulata TaxID=110450 RepID=A0A6G1BMV8_9ORYZ|nr:hypothetical protein E2562_022859 [Oryza meyeriana var. granulata]
MANKDIDFGLENLRPLSISSLIFIDIQEENPEVPNEAEAAIREAIKNNLTIHRSILVEEKLQTNNKGGI